MGGKMPKEYHRKYYHKNKDYREKTILLNKLKKIKDTVAKIRELITIENVKNSGRLTYVSLPKEWKGKEVIVIDTELFNLDIRKYRSNYEVEKT